MAGAEFSSLIRPVTALLLGAAILLMGNGLTVALLPLRADAEHFTQLDIGILGSAYFAGLMMGCLVGPAVMTRVGHIRSFAAFTAVASLAPLLHAIFPLPIVWWLLRGLTGICFAGLFMVIESWLNAVASTETRGRVLATYTIINLTVVSVGIQLIQLGDPKSFELFSLIAILFSLAAVPVALQTSHAPEAPKRAKLRLAWLMSISPAAVFGCFIAGLTNGAFWAYAPIYALRSGLPVPDVGHFLALVVLGGAVTQWPIGYLSDTINRRTVLAIVAALAAACGVGLYLARFGPPSLIFALGAGYGSMAYPLHAVCVAHANDLVHPKRAVEVSSGLLLTFASGAILGPFLAAFTVQAGGPGALFLQSASAHAFITLVMVLRLLLRPRPLGPRQGDFVATPQTTPAVFSLDPRGERKASSPSSTST
ncbi:MAG: MFS transporter [Hyphomonadaceae bacterium]|nr:MFS transporter [Hyphomonadaceae bacterium]